MVDLYQLLISHTNMSLPAFESTAIFAAILAFLLTAFHWTAAYLRRAWRAAWNPRKTPRYVRRRCTCVMSSYRAPTLPSGFYSLLSKGEEILRSGTAPVQQETPSQYRYNFRFPEQQITN